MMIRTLLNRTLSWTGRRLAKIIQRELQDYQPICVSGACNLEEIIQPGDVVLVEGNLWVSGAIKYLTQSTWSHAALCVGKQPGMGDNVSMLVEADMQLGVVAVPLSKYEKLNTRICRPLGLNTEDKERVIAYMMRHVGDAYDLKHLFDLARYLMPTPPVPRKFRRRLIALGSGDPTRAICSSLIAQAFQSVGHPIMPAMNVDKDTFESRHHSLFTPRDFDLSPYFEVIKPTARSQPVRLPIPQPSLSGPKEKDSLDLRRPHPANASGL